MIYNIPGRDLASANRESVLGTVHEFNGIKYMYVRAGEEISTTDDEPYLLAIDESHVAMKATAALGLVNHRVGVAPSVAIADDDYFWARIEGAPIPLRVSASAAADVKLGFGGVGAAGRPMSSVTASAGNVIVPGLCIVAAASASASAGNTIRNAILTNPVFKTAVAD